jgi:hypothetical protein
MKCHALNSRAGLDTLLACCVEMCLEVGPRLARVLDCKRLNACVVLLDLLARISLA